MVATTVRRRIIWDDDSVDIKPLKHTVARKIEAPELISNKKKKSVKSVFQSPVAGITWKQAQVTATGAIVTEPNPGSGNGHKFTASRPLTADERTLICKWWLKRGGIVTTNDVVELRSKHLSDLGIFQIGGYISVLHRRLATGELKIGNVDIQAYNKNRKARGQSCLPALKISNDPHPKFVVIAKQTVKKYHAKYTA